MRRLVQLSGFTVLEDGGEGRVGLDPGEVFGTEGVTAVAFAKIPATIWGRNSRFGGGGAESSGLSEGDVGDWADDRSGEYDGAEKTGEHSIGLHFF